MTTDHQISPLKIAYTPSGGAQWTGGLTYQKNLLTALQEHAPDVKVFSLSESSEKVVLLGPNISHVQYPPVNVGLISSLVNKVTLRLFGHDYLLAQSLRSISGGVNLVFPGQHRAGRGVAVLYWIPDLQFLHLPEMYSNVQISGLGRKFRQGAHRATLVVLSSQDAQQDFKEFLPEYLHKTRVMHFVAHIPENLYDVEPSIVVDEYNLPEKFIYLPNQFWRHKNHIVVFEALKLLKEKKITPFIVFTGNPIDSRNPLHFANLIQKISEWGIREQVAFLGLVPHDHVYGLIRQSICVINPSLFEGWSTTVEEAKSVGKRVILSDLPVHREQNPPGSFYFDPKNPNQLADLLADWWRNLTPGPDAELESQARQAYPLRMKQFADTFVSIAAEALQLAQK